MTDPRSIFVPGRVNLIGEHIDYHGLPVLPIAMQRGIHVAWRTREDRRVSAVSEPYGRCEFELSPGLAPAAPGDWQNYVRAAAMVAQSSWEIRRGIDAAVTSDLPAAAGVSSSTALLVAFTLALLRANGHSPTFEELMRVLPDGEQVVGTRGGGMDHAAVLGSRAGYASLIEFEPVRLRPIKIPDDWSFLIAHSLVTAEKSGAAREHYNARRAAGVAALRTLGVPSYGEAVSASSEKLTEEDQRDAFLHVTSEALRVRAAVEAMERADAGAFGLLLRESHASLRDRLKVSCPALDHLVDLAGTARLTGAGFGGFVVIFCLKRDRSRIRQRLIDSFYSKQPNFQEDQHLLDAEAASGALNL